MTENQPAAAGKLEPVAPRRERIAGDERIGSGITFRIGTRITKAYVLSYGSSIRFGTGDRGAPPSGRRMSSPAAVLGVGGMASAGDPVRSGRDFDRAGQDPDRRIAAGALCADEGRPVRFSARRGGGDGR